MTRIVCPIFQPIFCSRPDKQPTRISKEQNSLKRSEHAIVNRSEWILKRAVSLCLSNPLPFSLLTLLFLAHTKLPFDSNKSIFAPGYRLLLIIITAATPWFLIIQSAFDQTNRIKQKLTVNCGQWKYSFLGVVSTKRCLSHPFGINEADVESAGWTKEWREQASVQASVWVLYSESIYRKKYKWWSIDMAFEHFYVCQSDQWISKFARRKCEELCADKMSDERTHLTHIMTYCMKNFYWWIVSGLILSLWNKWKNRAAGGGANNDNHLWYRSRGYGDSNHSDTCDRNQFIWDPVKPVDLNKYWVRLGRFMAYSKG